MTKKSTHRVTLEELATMIAREFEGVADRFKKIDDQLDQLATKEDVREQLVQTMRAFEGLDYKVGSTASSWSRDFERLHRRVTAVEDWVRQHPQAAMTPRRASGIQRPRYPLR